ncbi:MAG: tetratricopeptide repeat protein [Fimbriimonadales bacterium]
MQRVVGLLGAMLLWACAVAQPTLLIFADPVPPISHNDQPYNPNIDLKPHLTPFLEALRKVRVEWYSPTHPVARQFAEQRGLKPEQLANPTPAIRAQIARAWGADFVMTVRCTRAPEQTSFEYFVKVWRLGARAPLWETEGFQQVATQQGKLDEATALQTLGRTVALRLDAELWDSLPRLAEQIQTPTPAAVPSPPTPSAESRPTAEQLLREGKYAEALPHLRAAVNAHPEDPTLRMELIRLYRHLNLLEQAQRELARSVELYPDNERFVLAWAEMLQAEGKPAEAISRLQGALNAQPNSVALRLALFDAHLMQGDANAAARTLQPIAQQDDGEVAYRRYLLLGATRTLENLPDGKHTLTEARAALWLQIVSGLMTDLANELLDLRRLASDPSPNWSALRPRGEQAVLHALRIGQWAERVQPTDATRRTVAHAQFASQMLAQAAQQMARYLLSRNSEEEARASLLRVEALRELESAQNALPKRTP